MFVAGLGLTSRLNLMQSRWWGRGSRSVISGRPSAPVSLGRVSASCKDRAIPVVVESRAVFTWWSILAALWLVRGLRGRFLFWLFLPLLSTGVFFGLVGLGVHSAVVKISEGSWRGRANNAADRRAERFQKYCYNLFFGSLGYEALRQQILLLQENCGALLVILLSRIELCMEAHKRTSVGEAVYEYLAKFLPCK